MPRPKKVLPTEDLYTLTFTMGTEKRVAIGTTALDTLEKLDAPRKITIKSFLTLTYQDKKIEIMMMPNQMRRFLYPFAHFQSAKKLMLLLK